jgi:hypothetical protein
MRWTGWLVVVMLVDHRSTRSVSISLIPGSIGGGPAPLMPGSLPGRSSTAAPASQIAWRRSSPKQSNAPAVASASTCLAVIPVRRTRLAIDA